MNNIHTNYYFLETQLWPKATIISTNINVYHLYNYHISQKLSCVNLVFNIINSNITLLYNISHINNCIVEVFHKYLFPPTISKNNLLYNKCLLFNKIFKIKVNELHNCIQAYIILTKAHTHILDLWKCQFFFVDKFRYSCNFKLLNYLYLISNPLYTIRKQNISIFHNTIQNKLLNNAYISKRYSIANTFTYIKYIPQMHIKFVQSMRLYQKDIINKKLNICIYTTFIFVLKLILQVITIDVKLTCKLAKCKLFMCFALISESVILLNALVNVNTLTDTLRNIFEPKQIYTICIDSIYHKICLHKYSKQK